MSSKKYRKKLKDQYNPKKKINWYETDKNAERDREIIENNNLYYSSRSSLYSNIKYIRENIDTNIISIKGKGYQYVL